MNPINAVKYLSLVNRFKANHPKLPQFIRAAGSIADEGTVVEMTVTTSEGKKIVANIKLNSEDLAIIREFRELKAKQRDQ
jgi:hypothetical protein